MSGADAQLVGASKQAGLWNIKDGSRVWRRRSTLLGKMLLHLCVELWVILQ